MPPVSAGLAGQCFSPSYATSRPPLREQVLEGFAPASLLWRRNVLGHAIEIQHQTLQGLQAWCPLFFPQGHNTSC
jgi:hypothetical protein